jgi:hypothetical protein
MQKKIEVFLYIFKEVRRKRNPWDAALSHAVLKGLNNKNVLTPILNLGAILNFHAWQHWFFLTIL